MKPKPPPVNDFQECLQLSHAAADLPFWEEVYRKAFPTMRGMFDERQDGRHQAAGVDRKLILPGTRQVLIDEKVRGRSKITGRVYPDIALEFVSNTKTGAPGWVCKPLDAEYIAYAIAPLGRCHLLPVLPLQEAWRKHGEQWQKEFGVRDARNKGYVTKFSPVTEKALYAAIGAWHRVDFTPFDLIDSDQ